ncbi:hypothetical protein PVAND_013002 [Polypedilum vanderplanki]|uniref:Uncharacterized protein n=1 Tax=Polypedilum vanderplanki TaxID=319348 RepID=A0A9J6CNC5_POLVA|nr:hypothetical protein PVAND_013002 [Polypedilum vanderplanki]
MVISLIKLITQESSMHGLRHITDDRRDKFSKIFWLCVVITSICLLFLSGYNVYFKWNIAPEIGLRVNQKSMADLPFPAITICSSVLARDNLINLTKAINSVKAGQPIMYTPKEQNYFAANSHICIPDHMKKVNDICKNRTEFNIMKLINESSLNTGEMLKSCSFREISFDCEKLFTRSITDYGYCHTFNMLDHDRIFNQDTISSDFDVFRKTNQLGINMSLQWTLDENYIVNRSQDILFPVRSLKKNILIFYTYLNETDSINTCQQIGKVFPIILHMPNEIPTPFHEEMYLEYGRRKQVTIMLKTYKSSNDLKKFRPKKRGCYFEGERQLKFFKSYTKAHCDFECMTNYTLKVCGCVKFSMPRTKGTPICDIDKGDCYYNAMLQWPKDGENSHRPCNCLETCNSIKYNILYSKDSFFSDYTGPSPLMDMKRGTYSVFLIRTRNHVIDEYENFAEYRLQNFVADFGGLMGLFLGCSIISLVELIYFCITGTFKKINFKRISFGRKINNIPLTNSKLQQFPKKFSPKNRPLKSNADMWRTLDQLNSDFILHQRTSQRVKF